MLWYFSDFKRKTFGTLAKSYWLRSLNCILHIQTKIFGIFLNLDDPFCHFGTFSKSFGCIFKTAFYAAQRKFFFFKKYKHFPSYSDLELNFSGPLAAKKYKFGQTIVRRAQRNFSGKHCFIKKNFLLLHTLSQTRSEKADFFAAF